MRAVRFINPRLFQAGCLVLVGVLALGTVGLANHQHTSSKFEGPKANTGTVSHSKQGHMHVLTLSDDFVVPDTPAPHWQVVDSKGNVYLLNRLKIKGDKFNQSIMLPAYVKDVSKVQIWCAFAETLLGEAKFADPVK
ncbi:MAG: hypothetical protein AB1898_09400 [Acidobacteriota bacterium]